MKKYRVKDIFPSLQGEGQHTGTPAVFLRFAGCNLWSGKEEDRASALCRYCDTDFVGGSQYYLEDLLDAIGETWQAVNAPPIVVVTGGEPLLQLDQPLVDGIREMGADVHVETNGTVKLDIDVDWVTCSPKPLGPELKITPASVDEYKVVYPQEGLRRDLDLYEYIYSLENRKQVFVQPNANVASAVSSCLRVVTKNTNLRLSLQTHKILELR